VIRADEVKALVDQILKNFYRNKILQIDCADMDMCSFEHERLLELGEARACKILKTEDEVEDDRRSFSLYAMSRPWNQSAVEGLQQDIGVMADEASLAKCKKCRNFFNLNKVDGCVGRKIGALNIEVKDDTAHEVGWEGTLSDCACRQVEIGDVLKHVGR
jgi:hypothetical protein